MPAKSEKQRRFMAACEHGAGYPSCPKNMTRGQMHDFAIKPSRGLPKVILHMPKGATQSPKGDLGKRNAQEYAAQRGFKHSGTYLDSQAAFGSAVSEPGKIGEKD